jgi:2-oxoglutarate dehydrogenase E2 component (dihydrolipoamide succinyltransferase)
MAITNVVVPQLSESVSEATLLTWKKQPGQAVEADEILIEVETDKVVLEVPAPASGVLSEIVKANGSMVTSGEVLARIDTEGKAAAPTAAPAAAVAAPVAAAAAPAPTAASGAIASPAASKILADKGVSAASVAGSGRDGRITKGDALNASTASVASAAKAAPLANPSVPMTQSLDGRPEQRVPMSRLRARVAERLLQSQQDNAILTTFNEVNMQAVIDLRNLYKDKFEKEHGVKLGFMSFFVKAAVAALKRYPLLNASVDGKDIIYHGYFDIGIAVGSPRGLVVPILRNADQLSIADIEKTIADFGKRAGEGKLGIEEMTGGTFSISNGGVFGSMLSTPIINPPQSAILGVHATKERAVVEKGQIVIRPINYLAMSYDHRIIDGREAVLGLVAMKEALEDPQRLLLEI